MSKSGILAWFTLPAVIALVFSMFSLTSFGAVPAAAQPDVTIYPSNTVPSTPADSDSGNIELGVRFNVGVAGTVVGLKFYKNATNTGTHTGSLWTSSGTRLATATFTAESTSGWQTVKFVSGVALRPGKTYVASYHTSTGHYSQQEWAFRNGATLGNKVIQATSGTYQYGATGFPTSTFRQSAYYVDVLFDPTAATPPPTTTPPTTTPPTTTPVPPSSTVATTTVPPTTTTRPTTVPPTTTTRPTTVPPTTTTVPPTTPVPPPPTSFPTSTNTGVPAGTALTAYTGSCNLAAGTVIDAKILNCPVEIMGSGVKITRSQINGIVQSDHSDSGRGAASVSITDSRIDGGSQEEFPTVSYDSVTLLRDEVIGGQHSVQCNSNCSITDSYLHAQYLPSSSAGHVNAFISNGGTGFTLRHNTLWCSVTQTSNDGGCSGDASVFGDFGPIKNVVFDNNLFHNTGGSYCLFGGQEPSKPYSASNVTITNNVFQRGGHSNNCGYYGPVTSLGGPSQGYVFTGNKYDDGSPVAG